MPLEDLEVHFDCARSQNLGVCGGCFSRLRSCGGAVHILGHGDHFSWQAQGKPHVLVLQNQLVVTGARDPERLYFELQISWQVQRFGHGGDLRRALISHSHSHSFTLTLDLTLSHSLTHSLSLSLSLSLTLSHSHSHSHSHTHSPPPPPSPRSPPASSPPPLWTQCV